MDCALTRKGEEISRLQKQLDSALSLNERPKSGLEDFTIDLGLENYIKIEGDFISENPNDYVIDLGSTQLDLTKNLDGYYECPDDTCDYKSPRLENVELHYGS